MNSDHDAQRFHLQDAVAPLPPAQQRFLQQRHSVDCLGAHRAWDLHPGDYFRGHTIASVHGVVGLASSPVAVLSFTGMDPEHTAQTRIGAAHTDMDSGCDDVWRAARAWVRGHGLHEGDSVDLDRLRTEVLDAAERGSPQDMTEIFSPEAPT
jgi:hypothetical protein